ncbi:MAG: transglycosylase SLT domain-containing protein [Cyanobium sp.]
MIRLPRLLAVSCLGTGALLLLGDALLERLPALTPLTPIGQLQRVRRFAPDPARRREASLLLAARPGVSADPYRLRQVLRHQGWGPDPLAALVLKLEARAAEAQQRPQQAAILWGALLSRFPGDPASADALYSLGRRQPTFRRQLLGRFPAHPAALAAALEAGPAAADRRDGLLHLARWGARWPGAEERLRLACSRGPLSPSDRGVVASALAELGDGDTALACLRPGASLQPRARLALAQSLLRGTPQQQPRALALLVDLADGSSLEAEGAVWLLAGQEGAAAQAALARLPRRWQDSAPVAARRALDAGNDQPALQVLRHWPADPASWDLQWERSRSHLLAGRWMAALTVLQALPAATLPPPLAARQQFWVAYSQRQLGNDPQARDGWRSLLRRHPGGYYGWRAAVQLGENNPVLQPSAAATALAAPSSLWQPLESGEPVLDRLWRLDQRDEAWETWRSRRAGAVPRRPQELALEGRLRQGVGDDWSGLALLERAQLELPADQCPLEIQLERDLHPRRFEGAFSRAARRHQISEALLLGLAKQESRFTPAVHSVVGAVGLMQLMPETAAELAGRSISVTDLEDPDRNTDLGSLYLRRLLQQWNGDPLLTVASYNAGPGAVQRWIQPRLRQAPELWVEAIPFPETRLYVKKVLGNAWSYQQQRLPGC